MAVDFTDFTTGGTLSPDNYLVGYDVDASGGEKKWKYSTLRDSLTSQIGLGTFYPVGGGNDKIFWENSQTVTQNYTVTNSKNAMTVGPITVAAGVSVTVPAGSVWTVV
jgi:hypothetical protein